MPRLAITLPWPPSSLSPNTRQHWSKLAKAKGEYRRACYFTAIEQGAKPIRADHLHLHLQFVPPNRRKFDLDNLLARMKSGLDGLVDAIGVDDSRWQIRIQRSDVPVPPGFVLVTVGLPPITTNQRARTEGSNH